MCQLVWLNDYNKDTTKFMCLCRQETRWEVVRYFIEDKYRMVATEDYQRKNANTCIVGIRAADVKKPTHEICALGDDCNVQVIGPIVLWRFPVGTVRVNAFVPLSLRIKMDNEQNELQRMALQAKLNKQMQDPSLSEDEKLILLRNSVDPSYLAATEQPTRRQAPREHPSRSIIRSKFAGYWNYAEEAVLWTQTVVEPPPTWKCYRCYNFFTPVHYIDACPSQKIALWIPMNKRIMPTGRPKTTLKQVSWDDFDAVAAAPYLDPYGQLWTNK
jgi:hypothetical protein